MKSTDIDSKFFPFESEKPFQGCTICGIELANGVDYVVEKALKGNDVIFEIASCLPCAEKMREGFSKKTREAIDKFFEENVDLAVKTVSNMFSTSTELEEHISNCLISGEPIDQDKEYQIYAFCGEGKMHFTGLYPFAMSGTSIDRIAELISPESQGFLDDLYDDFLIPDDLRDLLKSRPVLI